MRITLIKKILLTCILTTVVLFNMQSQDKDFKIKGFHLDLRSQVMTMPALKSFVKELAAFQINTLIMEWEATFPYNDNVTISNKYAYKPHEIKGFIEYCTLLGIDVIPIHHCFGHVEWILRHDRYRFLSEDSKEVSQVCPMKESRAIETFTSLFKELIAYHPSKYFHIGGDETYLLGHCRACKAKAEKEGKSKLFVDYIKSMCKIVTDLGKIPVLWADIIVVHPEAIHEMPENAIYVDWNYGWEINRFGDMQKLYDTGTTIWGAPALRSAPDNFYLTDWIKHFNNQKSFIPYGRKAGYEGMIMTSWSNSGLYSFLFDNGWEIQDMEQIRNVYPLNGFRILLAAYGKAVNQSEAIDPENFVIDYAQSRFGLNKEQGGILWKVLSAKQEVVQKGKSATGVAVNDMLEEVTTLNNLLKSLRPKKNKKEFEHFKLMFDIRENYLNFKAIENIYQSSTFNRSQVNDLYKKMNQVLKEETKLDKRFNSLQKGFLHDEEIKHQNTIRKRKMIVVRDFLRANKST